MRLRGSERHRFGVVGSSSIATSAVVAVIAHVVISATVAAGTPTASIAAYRLSATALFMGGTGQPLIIPPDTPEFISSYVNKMNTDFVATTGLCTGGDPGCTLIAVYTPEQLRPLIGDMTFDESAAIGLGLLDNCIQGAACTATYAPFTTTYYHRCYKPDRHLLRDFRSLAECRHFVVREERLDRAPADGQDGQLCSAFQRKSPQRRGPGTLRGCLHPDLRHLFYRRYSDQFAATHAIDDSRLRLSVRRLG